MRSMVNCLIILLKGGKDNKGSGFASPTAGLFSFFYKWRTEMTIINCESNHFCDAHELLQLPKHLLRPESA